MWYSECIGYLGVSKIELRVLRRLIYSEYHSWLEVVRNDGFQKNYGPVEREEIMEKIQVYAEFLSVMPQVKS